MKHFWIWYDGRAEFIDTDDCSILEACESRRDVRQSISTWTDHDAVLFEYDVEGENTLVNERKVGHVRQGYGLMRKVSKNQELRP